MHNRRDFLKKTTLGAGIIASGFIHQSCDKAKTGNAGTAGPEKKSAIFNMCGYAAPKLDKVRIGYIGLGGRGSHAVMRMSHIEGVEIKALCDIRKIAVDASQKTLADRGLPVAEAYYGKEDSWQSLCQRDDLDLIYICTPWNWHAPMAIYGMKQGKHVAVEVPAAKTMEEAWELVEVSENKRKHCMMLENCCYDFFELLTLNMARQGFFGDIVHGECAYLHTLLESNFQKFDENKLHDNGYYEMWRLRENTRNGNLYPTHGLGPICQIMDINRGDRMDYLTSMSSNDFQMAEKANEMATTDKYYEEFVGKSYRGNMNTTMIRTLKGRTIMVQHDVTSPRPYSRIHLVSGTKAMARKYPSVRISRGHEWLPESEIRGIESEFTPEIVHRVGEFAKKVGGHGGMDFIMDWRLIDCLRNGLALDQNVYDAALWSSIAPLSEKSVTERSIPVDIPDFTRGNWEINQPFTLDIS